MRGKVNIPRILYNTSFNFHSKHILQMKAQQNIKHPRKYNQISWRVLLLAGGAGIFKLASDFKTHALPTIPSQCNLKWKS